MGLDHCAHAQQDILLQLVIGAIRRRGRDLIKLQLEGDGVGGHANCSLLSPAVQAFIDFPAGTKLLGRSAHQLSGPPMSRRAC